MENKGRKGKEKLRGDVSVVISWANIEMDRTIYLTLLNLKLQWVIEKMERLMMLDSESNPAITTPKWPDIWNSFVISESFRWHLGTWRHYRNFSWVWIRSLYHSIWNRTELDNNHITYTIPSEIGNFEKPWGWNCRSTCGDNLWERRRRSWVVEGWLPAMATVGGSCIRRHRWRGWVGFEIYIFFFLLLLFLNKKYEYRY